MKRAALGTIAIALLAVTAPAALAAEQQSSAYSGSTVSFDAKSNAVVDYSVGGTTVAESISVQSRSEAKSSLGLSGSVDLAAVVNLTGAALSVESSADASATIQAESGATMLAHDNGHGSLVVATVAESTFESAEDVQVQVNGECRGACLLLQRTEGRDQRRRQLEVHGHAEFPGLGVDRRLRGHQPLLVARGDDDRERQRRVLRALEATEPATVSATSRSDSVATRARSPTTSRDSQRTGSSSATASR